MAALFRAPFKPVVASLGWLFMLVGCTARPFVSAAPPDPPTHTAPPSSAPIPEPSLMLTLTRSERLLSQTRLTPTTTKGEIEGLPTVTEHAREHEGESLDDGEVRVIVVRSSRFATPEDLARAAIRSAEPRRARLLNEARFLVRASGFARPTDSCGVDGNEARVAARTLLRASRAEIKRCLIDAVVADPNVTIKGPTALVLEQQMGDSGLMYRFTAHFGPGADAPRIADPDGVLDEGMRRCKIAALRSEAARVASP